MPTPKHKPLKHIARARNAGDFRPRRLFTGLWYRIHGLSTPQVRAIPHAAHEGRVTRDVAYKRISFTFALIALSARVATAGAPLTREKYATFRDAFPLTGGICAKIRALFSLACDNPVAIDQYAAQIRNAFPRQIPLFMSLVERLFSIAAAGGEITREAERMLARIAHLLELSPAQYTEIYDRYAGRLRAHHVLGVSRRTPLHRLKQRYRELMRRYHPDRFALHELSPEVALLLHLKTSEINAAYRELSRQAA